MSDSAILIRDLKKIYKAAPKSTKRFGVIPKRDMKNQGAEPKTALAGVHLDIPRGAFYGLLGPNGAGKSTLINIIAGLSLKTSGKVIIDGIDQDIDARGTRRKVGIVPQEVVLDPFFTVREMLEYHAGYYGIPKHQRRTDQIMAALSLSDKANASSRRLSGGMKRRVLIAKALVHTPGILILDEPTAGVDVELRHQLWEYVKELNAQGTTVLLTTHYLEEAETLCDRVAIIHHGQIVAEDKTSHLIKTLDQKQLSITFSTPLATVPEGFLTLARDMEMQGQIVNTILDKDGRLVITYPSSRVSIDVLLQHACTSGYSISDLSTQEASLEDIFRRLTFDERKVA